MYINIFIRIKEYKNKIILNLQKKNLFEFFGLRNEDPRPSISNLKSIKVLKTLMSDKTKLKNFKCSKYLNKIKCDSTLINPTQITSTRVKGSINQIC